VGDAEAAEVSVVDDVGLFDVPEAWWRRRRCIVCGCALSVQHTHTYVVQRERWIKIGATDKPRRRINELSRPAWTQHILSPAEMDWEAPLTTLVVMVRDIEHELHGRFADQHAIGEWFHPGGELDAWLDDQSQTLGLGL
jgi:hypothetical protein